MLHKLILFLLAIPLCAQTWTPVAIAAPGTNVLQINYVQQGAASLRTLTGSKIKGVGFVGVNVCNLSALQASVPAGLVRQWGGQHGISWLYGPANDTVLAQSARASLPQLALNFAADVPSIGTGLIAGRIISTSSGTWGLALGGAQVVFAIIKPRLAAAVPDTSKVTAAAMPLIVTVPPNSCSPDYLGLARYQKELGTVSLQCSAGTCKEIQ